MSENIASDSARKTAGHATSFHSKFVLFTDVIPGVVHHRSCARGFAMLGPANVRPRVLPDLRFAAHSAQRPMAGGEQGTEESIVNTAKALMGRASRTDADFVRL